MFNKRSKLIKEVYDTENTYVKKLNGLVNVKTHFFYLNKKKAKSIWRRRGLNEKKNFKGEIQIIKKKKKREIGMNINYRNLLFDFSYSLHFPTKMEIFLLQKFI